MNILLLGGTGAIGKDVATALDNGQNEVYVTSRSTHADVGQVHYLQGNARDLDFLKQALKTAQWDTVVDFMVYHSQDDFTRHMNLMLENTHQYVFLSSCRVFAASNAPITENSPRHLEANNDDEFLNSYEYAVAKAKQEDALRKSKYGNWTIIRPYITFNDNRLQLGVMEKENWLYRALHGRTIVFSDDIASKLTTLTSGHDVSACIAKVIGQPSSLGKTYNVTAPEQHTWSEILNIYLETLEKHLGKQPKVMMTKEYKSFYGMPFQVKYDRLYDRTFDNSKISQATKGFVFSDVRASLTECLERFMYHPRFLQIDWAEQAYLDKLTKERASLKEIPGWRSKLVYIHLRYFSK